MELLYPPADRSAAWFAGLPAWRGRAMARTDCVVWHTTEGNSLPNYRGGLDAPQFTYDPRRHVWYQHAPVNVAGRALVDTPGGVTTNRQNVVQVEIIGTSGWATRRNSRRSYTLDEAWYIENLDDQAIEDLAKFAAWMHTANGVPLTARGFGDWANGARRMTPGEWNTFYGHCGHQHVPENDHTDPGLLPIQRILDRALSLVNGTPEKPKSTPTEGDEMLLRRTTDGGFFLLLPDGARGALQTMEEVAIVRRVLEAGPDDPVLLGELDAFAAIIRRTREEVLPA